ncbi:TPA: amino acid permease [Candidatus Micrarchaeota archaeon]|nr:amino acid permease [Candidatus Micrarchaeota archaeon]
MRRLRLARDLGLWDSVLLGIGFIVGSGIFLMPVLAAQTAGSWSLVAWFLAGIFTIITGLCFAELAVRIPKAGGLYAYAHEVLGEFWGFITGYAFWMSYWVTIAVETLALALYLSFFTTLTLGVRIAISIFIALMLTAINYRGVKLGGEAEDVFTIAKLIPLGILVIAGIAVLNPQSLSSGFQITQAVYGSQGILGAIFASFVLVLWAYQGVEIITVPEEEIKNARKTVPRAIIIAVVSVMLLYLLVSLVVLGSVRWQDYAGSETALADIGGKLIGKWGGLLLALGGLVSILGALNAVILASARISFAMARDGLFPSLFYHIHPMHYTPDRALLFHMALVCLLLFFIHDFISLASLVVLFTLIPWFFSCVAAFKLQRAKHEHSLFNSQWVPALAVLSTAALIAYLLMQYWLQTLVVLIVGIAYYLNKRSGNGIKALPTPMQ